MKKYFVFSIVLVIMVTISAFAYADSNTVTINVNNMEYSIFDQVQKIETPAFIYNGRTVMPLRKSFDIFGVAPQWNAEDRSVTANYKDKSIWLQIDNKVAKVNGQEVTLDVPAMIVNNRTYVPLRFVSETFGVTPTWDDATRTVGIELSSVYLGDFDLSLVIGNSYQIPMKVNNIYEINSNESFNKTIFVLSKQNSFESQITTYHEGYGFESDQIKMFLSKSNYRIYKVLYNDMIETTQNILFFIDYGTKHDIIHFRNIDELESDKIIMNSFN